MDYPKLYIRIIDNARSKARSKKDNKYYESHHIIPKCLGGSDCLDNKVFLTAREHFIVHWILYRIHPTNRALVVAFKAMFANKTKNRYSPSSRAFEEARIAFSKSQKGEKNHMFGKTNQVNLGRKHTEETKRRISESRKDILFTEEHRKNIGLAKVGKQGKGKEFMATSQEGQIIRFRTSTDFAKQFNCHPSCITRCLKGVKHRLKGFTNFKYI
jgi:hypothetical protein